MVGSFLRSLLVGWLILVGWWCGLRWMRWMPFVPDAQLLPQPYRCPAPAAITLYQQRPRQHLPSCAFQRCNAPTPAARYRNACPLPCFAPLAALPRITCGYFIGWLDGYLIIRSPLLQPRSMPPTGPPPRWPSSALAFAPAQRAAFPFTTPKPAASVTSPQPSPRLPLAPSPTL